LSRKHTPMNRIEHLIQARLRRAGLAIKATFHNRLADKVAVDLEVRKYLEAASDAEIVEAIRPPKPRLEEARGVPI
jgi:hypothetical protein